MKRLALLSIWLALPLCLCGCPSNVQQQAAQASLNASIVIQTGQKAELAAFQQGLISATDHQFIEQQFSSISTIGKTVDSCIGSASTQAATVSCLNTAISGIQTIEASGGLYLKSATAQNDFQVAVQGVISVLASIDSTLGGIPPSPAPTGGTP